MDLRTFLKSKVSMKAFKTSMFSGFEMKSPRSRLSSRVHPLRNRARLIGLVTSFILAILEHSPDLYLDELQTQLKELHNVDISLSTIWRTLRRLGMKLKGVCPSFLSQPSFSEQKPIYYSFPSKLLNALKNCAYNSHFLLAKKGQNILSLLMSRQSMSWLHSAIMVGHHKALVHASVVNLCVVPG